MYRFESLNQALIGMSKELLEKGVKRKTRGFDCVEMPHPVLIYISNPSDRYITIPERKWNKILPFVESLWIALGLNNLNSLPGHYVKNLYNFSDNGETWRAGYGPRIRAFTGVGNDYHISDPRYRNVYSANTVVTDQLKFVIESLKKDINTRQAVITIHDPAKDNFGEDGLLKITKDQPCTRSLHFQVNTFGELDIIVDIRSNDLLWGFSAVNVTNFTIMQEYVATMLNLPLGKYYHKADNLHFYENFREKIESFAKLDFEDFKTGEIFQYLSNPHELKDFDHLLEILYSYEKSLRVERSSHIVDFGDPLFNDWGKVFYMYHTKKEVKFLNPYLNKLFYGRN